MKICVGINIRIVRINKNATTNQALKTNYSVWVIDFIAIPKKPTFLIF